MRLVELESNVHWGTALVKSKLPAETTESPPYHLPQDWELAGAATANGRRGKDRMNREESSRTGCREQEEEGWIRILSEMQGASEGKDGACKGEITEILRVYQSLSGGDGGGGGAACVSRPALRNQPPSFCHSFLNPASEPPLPSSSFSAPCLPRSP
eukprot:2281801-Rhodomonas_salina.5